MREPTPSRFAVDARLESDCETLPSRLCYRRSAIMASLYFCMRIRNSVRRTVLAVCGATLCVGCVPGFATAQSPTGYFRVHGDREDYVTLGYTYAVDCNVGFRLVAYDVDFDGSPDSLGLYFGAWGFWLAGPPENRSIVPGVYENASSSGLNGGPLMSVGGGYGRGCPESVGRFEILEADYSTEDPPGEGNLTVRSIALRFESACGDDPAGPGLRGLLVFNSTREYDTVAPVVANVAMTRTKFRRSRPVSATISWTASDDSGDLSFEVLWSPNPTLTEVIARKVPAGTTSITWTPPPSTPLTTEGVITIVASDRNGNAVETRLERLVTIKR